MKVIVKNVVLDKQYITEEDIEFNINNIKIYKDLFEEYKNKSIISNCSFDDNVWYIRTHMNSFAFVFDFDEVAFTRRFGNLMKFEEFIISIKAFYLYLLRGKDAGTLSNSFTRFKKVCKITSFLQSGNENKFKNFFMVESNRAYVKYAKEFWFEFAKCDLIDLQYYKTAEKLCNYRIKSGQRDLPSFESMFKLDEMIDDFYNHRNTLYKGLKEKYFPIILWWKITSIIPLRTIELTVIPSDCVNVVKSEKGVEYTITLNRSISKGGAKSLDMSRHSFEKSFRATTIRTTEEIYNLVNEYKEMVDYYDNMDNYFFPDTPGNKRQFLFSYRSYFSQMSHQTQLAMLGKYSPSDLMEYFSENNFYNLYNSFFSDIVEGIYGKTIVSKQEKASMDNLIHYVQPMDTRHFAIMNMVLSGIEPTIIKELAGHKSINTTYGYSRHGKEYARNFILSVAKRQSKNNEVDYVAAEFLNEDGENQMSSSSKRYLLAKFKNKEFASKYRKVANGYCIYTEDDITPCILCAGNHERCSYYVSDESEGFLSLLKEQKNMNYEMNSEFETLSWLLNNYNKVEHWADRYKASLSKIKAYMNNQIEFRIKYQVLGDLS